MSEWVRPSGCSTNECIEVRASSCQASECIEVRKLPEAWSDDIALRVIRHGRMTQHQLQVTRGEWAAFVAAVKAGEFDDLG